jgi:hypothetical protein
MSHNTIYGPVEVYRFEMKEGKRRHMIVDLILHNSALIRVDVVTEIIDPEDPDHRTIKRRVGQSTAYTHMSSMMEAHRSRVAQMAFDGYQEVAIPNPHDTKALFAVSDQLENLIEHDDDPLYLDLGE